MKRVRPRKQSDKGPLQRPPRGASVVQRRACDRPLRLQGCHWPRTRGRRAQGCSEDRRGGARRPRTRRAPRAPGLRRPGLCWGPARLGCAGCRPGALPAVAAVPAALVVTTVRSPVLRPKRAAGGVLCGLRAGSPHTPPRALPAGPHGGHTAFPRMPAERAAGPQCAHTHMHARGCTHTYMHPTHAHPHMCTHT